MSRSAPGRALRAVLWDMDGTIVDTEPHWIEAELALVREHGGRWTDEDARSLIGNPLLVSAAVLQERGGVRLPAREIVDRLQAHVVEQVNRQVHWQPGARELLAALGEHGVACALVTMSWQPLARAVVDQLPPGTFRVVVTGDVVTHGKPHPEPYATAVRRLGVPAQACLAIEDSPTGLGSAEAAGVATVGVPHLLELPPGPRRTVVPTLADLSVEDLEQLLSATGQ
ncbi:HAD family hydrolase [Thalassiella azotivora]